MTVTPSLVLALTAALLAAAAVGLALPPRKRGRAFLRGPGGGPLMATGPSTSGGDARPTLAPHPPGSGGEEGTGLDEQDRLGRHRLLVSLLSGTAPVLLVGGFVGVAAGAVAAVVVHRSLGRREPAGVRRRREQIGRGLPQVVELLGVALAAGAAPSHALAVVAGAVEGPIAEELEAARRGLALGRDPARVWREVADRPGLAALGRTMARAVETGASVSDALRRLADDLQAVTRSEAEARARTVGVRAAAPLGLCLLPAFVLVGVVPLVAGTVASLLGT